MSINKGLIAELKYEAANTRKILERVPDEHLGWQPHEKSMTFGRLATHIAELTSWITKTIKTDEIDFSGAYKPYIAGSREELLSIHDKNVKEAIASLEETTDEHLMKPWVLRSGERIIVELPKAAAIRNTALNHLYHHRGQLTTYLRHHNIPVPGIYGPSADER